MYSSKVKGKHGGQSIQDFEEQNQQMLLNQKSGTSFVQNPSQLGHQQPAPFAPRNYQKSNSVLGSKHQTVTYSSLDPQYDARADAQRGSLPTTYADRGAYPPLGIPSNQVLHYSEVPP
jgi:hypothetical protein